MSHDMFDDVVRPSVRVGTRWYSVPLSVLTHSLLLGALIVAPLLATGELPMPRTTIDVILPPEPPLPPDVPVLNATPPPAPEVDIDFNAAPIDAPEGLKPEPPPRLTPTVGGLVPTAPSFGNMTAILAPQVAPQVPVRVGWQHQTSREDQIRRPGLSADCESRARVRHGHRRSDHRSGWHGQRRQDHPLSPDARSGRTGCRASVALHADAAERPANGSDHVGERDVCDLLGQGTFDL